MQENSSCLCLTNVKSRCECSQKLNVHWLCSPWPSVFLTSGGINRGSISSRSKKLLVIAHMRFGQSLKRPIALSTASAIAVSEDDDCNLLDIARFILETENSLLSCSNSDSLRFG